MAYDCIFKKNGVFVYVMDIEWDKAEDLDNDEDLVYCNCLSPKRPLYGGRVSLGSNGSNYVILDVDGICINSVSASNNGMYLSNSMSFSEAVAILNQIEQLGVDTFLENYKKQLVELKTTLVSEAERLTVELSEQKVPEKQAALTNIHSILAKLACILFAVCIHLNAGLENSQYIDAYNCVANLYLS